MTYNVTVHEWPDYDDPFYVGRQTVTDSCGRTLFTVQNLTDCPEDAIIARDLFTAYDYLDAVRFGIQLAQQGYTNIQDTLQKEERL